MPKHAALPSRRKRYWLKTREFEFLWHDGRVTETGTQECFEPSANSTIIGRGRLPTDDADAYYFDTNGKPDTDTHRRLLADFGVVLFLRRGRFLPPPTIIPTGESKAEWDQYLSRIGLPSRTEELESLAPVTDSRQDSDGLFRRPVWTRPPSGWRSWVISRLVPLLDRWRDDSLLLRLADYLCRTEDIHEWWSDPELDPVRKHLSETKRWRLMRAVENTAFGRIRWVRDRREARESAVISIKWRKKDFVVTVPRRQPRESERSHRNAVLALEAMTSLRAFRPGGRPPAEVVAACLWIARGFVSEPSAWKARPPTLSDLAARFRVAPDRIRRTAYHLQRHPGLGLLPTDRLLAKGSDAVVRAQIQSYRPARAITEEELRADPVGQQAVALIDEANALEHGWRWSPDLNVKPPAPVLIARARRLRKQGLKMIRSLQEKSTD